jgi:hypothetical protein
MRDEFHLHKIQPTQLSSFNFDNYTIKPCTKTGLSIESIRKSTVT